MKYINLEYTNTSYDSFFKIDGRTIPVVRNSFSNHIVKNILVSEKPKIDTNIISLSYTIKEGKQHYEKNIFTKISNDEKIYVFFSDSSSNLNNTILSMYFKNFIIIDTFASAYVDEYESNGTIEELYTDYLKTISEYNNEIEVTCIGNSFIIGLELLQKIDNQINFFLPSFNYDNLVINDIIFEKMNNRFGNLLNSKNVAIYIKNLEYADTNNYFQFWSNVYDNIFVIHSELDHVLIDYIYLFLKKDFARSDLDITDKMIRNIGKVPSLYKCKDVNNQLYFLWMTNKIAKINKPKKFEFNDLTINDDDTVSVIIIAYKYNENIERNINSILKQTHKNLDLVIVNNNDENSYFYHLVNDLVAKFDDSRIKVVFTKKAGSAQIARNLGLASSTSKYVKYMDDDDTLFPQTIENLILLLKNSDSNVSFGVDLLYFEDNHNTQNLSTNDFTIESKNYASSILSGNYFDAPTTTNCLIKRSCFDTLGNWNEKYIRHQDAELLQRFSVKDFIRCNMLTGMYYKDASKIKNVYGLLESKFAYIKQDILLDSFKHIYHMEHNDQIEVFGQIEYDIACVSPLQLNYIRKVINTTKKGLVKRNRVVLTLLNNELYGGIDTFLKYATKALEKYNYEVIVIAIEGKNGLSLANDKEKVKEILSENIILISTQILSHTRLQPYMNKESLKFIYFLGDGSQLKHNDPIYNSYMHTIENVNTNYDKYLFLTENNTNEFRKNNPEIQCDTLKLAVDYTLQNYNNIAKNDFIYVGRISYTDKNTVELIHVGIKLKEKKAPFKINVYGDGSDFNDFVNKIKKYKIENYVVAHGKTDKATEVIGNSLGLLNVSVTEGTPITFLEAYSVGTPIISYNYFVSAEEMIDHGKTGYVVNRGDISSFVDAMYKVYDGKLVDTKERITDIIAEYSPENFEKELLRQIYHVEGKMHDTKKFCEKHKKLKYQK